jgi:hypothetical protein
MPGPVDRDDQERTPPEARDRQRRIRKAMRTGDLDVRGCSLSDQSRRWPHPAARDRSRSTRPCARIPTRENGPRRTRSAPKKPGSSTTSIVQGTIGGIRRHAESARTPLPRSTTRHVRCTGDAADPARGRTLGNRREEASPRHATGEAGGPSVGRPGCANGVCQSWSASRCHVGASAFVTGGRPGKVHVVPVSYSSCALENLASVQFAGIRVAPGSTE